MYKCSRCQEYKLRSEVVVYAHHGDKKYYNCHTCNNARARDYYRRHPKRINAINRKSERRYPERQRARGLLGFYIRSGKVIKPEKCSKCGFIKPLQGHHPDYNEPGEVVWLCRKCHRRLHPKLKS